MNRWLLIGSLAGLLCITTGCLHHNTRGCGSGGGCGASACNSGACSSGACSSGACSSGTCSSGKCSSGLGGRLAGMCSGNCGAGGCGRTGCQAGKIGWQSGGLDYSSHLQTGLLGHTAAQNLNSRPFNAGPPTGQVAYPYYSHRGPRDFLMDNPPTIGR